MKPLVKWLILFIVNIIMFSFMIILLFNRFDTYQSENSVNPGNYSHESKTLVLGLTYYSDNNFDIEFNERLVNIETKIETQFIRNKFKQCLQEIQNKRNIILSAFSFGDQELANRMKSFKLNSCPQNLNN